MLKQLLTISILTFAFQCFAQSQFHKEKISPQTENIITKLEKEGAVMNSAVGYAGQRPKQYDNFLELQKTATKGELAELTNHPNEVVRCYAFWALLYDSSVDLFPIVIKHLDDTALVTTLFGCIQSSEEVGDFFIHIATPGLVDLDSKKLDSNQYAVLDSILIFTPNHLEATEGAISNAKLTENLYKKVRELVIKENDQKALVTLAKFEREEDIPIILSKKSEDDLFFTYKAISEFPHPLFLPFLKESLYETLNDTHYGTEWGQLYNAIASYKNDTALRLLQVPFTQVKHQEIREYYMQYLFHAVQSFYTSLYDELLWNLWGNEKLINPEIFEKLYQKNPQRAFQITKKTIENADDFYYLATGDYSDEGQNSVNLIDIMLDTIIKKDRPFAIKMINKNIREVNVHEFPAFANKVLILRDTSFISSLFARLETESNPYVYIEATKVLIAFNDKNINKKIGEIYRRNADLRKDWGGRDLAKLLRENKIL
jgi:hypothetical protein